MIPYSKEHEMNERLAARPLDPKRRIPVPFAQVVREDGTADFSAVDARQIQRCADERLCGLCGLGLAYWVAFIGGPASVASRMFVDPPMHVECAEDAFTLCPHLARPLVARRPATEGTAVPAGWTEGKPGTWSLGITRDFRWELRRAQGGGRAPVFVTSPFKSIRLWQYVDGRAVEVTA